MVPDSCRITFRVRYAECDPMGYLHHAKYLEYLEMGRTEILRAGGARYRDLEAQGVLFVVVKVACRYRKPAHYDDELTLDVVIERVTRARIDHAYKLYRGDVLLCEATSTIACVNRQGRPMAIPQDMVPTPCRPGTVLEPVRK